MTGSEEANAKEKVDWELRKLKAEVHQLSRPWLRTPASWVVIATTLIALTTTLVQWNKSDIDFKLAEIKRERAALETERLEGLRAQYSTEIRRAQARLTELLNRASVASANLNLAEKRLRSLGEQLPSTSESRAAVRQAEESLKSLRAANNELSKQTERTSNTLGGILEKVQDPVVPVPVFVTDIDLLRYCREKFGESFFPIDAQTLYCSDGRMTTEVDRSEVCRWVYGIDEVVMDFGSLRWDCKRP